MISPKLAILMATLAVVGAGAVPMAPMALAQDQEADVEIERNNEISQSISQEQEACTNEAEVSVSDDDEIDIGGENKVEVEQTNDCEVTQSQSAANVATIDDDSFNTIEIEQELRPLITCQNVLSFIDPNAIFSGPLEEFFRNCQITNPN